MKKLRMLELVGFLFSSAVDHFGAGVGVALAAGRLEAFSGETLPTGSAVAMSLNFGLCARLRKVTCEMETMVGTVAIVRGLRACVSLKCVRVECREASRPAGTICEQLGLHFNVIIARNSGLYSLVVPCQLMRSVQFARYVIIAQTLRNNPMSVGIG